MTSIEARQSLGLSFGRVLQSMLDQAMIGDHRFDELRGVRGYVPRVGHASANCIGTW